MPCNAFPGEFPGNPAPAGPGKIIRGFLIETEDMRIEKLEFLVRLRDEPFRLNQSFRRQLQTDPEQKIVESGDFLHSNPFSPYDLFRLRIDLPAVADDNHGLYIFNAPFGMPRADVFSGCGDDDCSIVTGCRTDHISFPFNTADRMFVFRRDAYSVITRYKSVIARGMNRSDKSKYAQHEETYFSHIQILPSELKCFPKTPATNSFPAGCSPGSA